MNTTTEKQTGFAPFHRSWGGICRLILGSLCLCAVFTARATEWTFTPGAENPNVIGTITDGQWTLKVTGFDKENGVLKFANWWGKSIIKAWSEPADSALSGVLDLRSPLTVVDEAGVRHAIANVVAGQSAFTGSSDLVALYCDILSFNGKDTGQFASNPNLMRIEIGGDADSLQGLLLNRNPKLKTVKFDFPAVRSIGSSNGQSIFGIQTSPDPIDVGTIAVPSVTNLFDYALNRSCIVGNLVLTNIVSMGTGAFNGASLTNLFLAGPLMKLNDYVFKGSTITNVLLDLPELAEVSSLAFNEQKYIRRVELVRTPADMGQVTNVIAAAAWGNTNLGENGYLVSGKWLPNNLRIYVSKKQWVPSAAETYSEDNPTGFFLGAGTFTAKEKQMIAADPTLKGAFGVCVRVVKGTLKRRAFFVHKKSPYDNGGLCIIIR